MINTTLRLITALHIGGGDDTMQIGGISKSVIKREIYANPDGSISYEGRGKKITEPYVPGSSVKGKMRSLLEHTFGLVSAQKAIKLENDSYKTGEPINSNFIRFIKDSGFESKDVIIKKANLIITLFGESAGSGDKKSTKITRAIFRDSFLTQETRRLYLEGKIKISEEKAENSINRVNVTANPRFLERVPVNIEFSFETVLREFDEDKQLPLKETLSLGLKLIEADSLGGGGSRGSGKVEFVDYEHKAKDVKTLLQEIENALNNVQD